MNKLFSTFVMLLFFCGALHAQKDAKKLYDAATTQMLISKMSMSLDIATTDNKGRTKDKAFDIYMATIDEVDKMKIIMQKPERAKGITVIFTTIPGETGTIEVLTPANGKIRKMKATPDNMALVGIDFFLMNYGERNSDDLEYKYLLAEELDGKKHHKISVAKKGGEDGRIDMWIEDGSNKLGQMMAFNNQGSQTSTTRFSSFKPVDNEPGKKYPRLIEIEDIENHKQTKINVLSIAKADTLKAQDFLLEETK